MAKILKKRSLASPSFRGSAKRLSSIKNKKKSDNQVSSDSSVVSFSTQASTSSRMSLPSFRRSKRLSRKKGTSSSVSLCELKDDSPEEEKTLAIVTVNEAEEAVVEEATPTPKATDAKETFFEHMSTAADAVIDLVQSLSGEDASVKGEDKIPDVEAVHTNEEPSFEAVHQGDDKVAIGFYQEPADDEVQEEKGVEESPGDKIIANTMAFFEESKTFMEENVMLPFLAQPKVKETLTYVEEQYAEHAQPKVQETMTYLEEHAQPKVQDTWAYLEEQMSGQCWGSPGATPTKEEEVIIIDTTVAKKMDLPVVDADPVEEISSLEDRNEDQPAADLQVMQQEIRV